MQTKHSDIAKKVIDLEIKSLKELKSFINSSLISSRRYCKLPIKNYIMWSWKKWINCI